MTDKEIQKTYDSVFTQIKNKTQEEFNKLLLGGLTTTAGQMNGVPTPQNIGVIPPSKTTAPISATQTQIMQQMQYAGGGLTKTEIDKLFDQINLKPYTAPNHMETLEKHSGFLWLDEEKTWGLVPFGSKPKVTSADIKKRPEIPGKFALMHRHDDDMMFEETALNARYHGDNYYICSNCHKPCPKEFVTLFVLQSTLSDGKPKT